MEFRSFAGLLQQEGVVWTMHGVHAMYVHVLVQRSACMPSKHLHCMRACSSSHHNFHKLQPNHVMLDV